MGAATQTLAVQMPDAQWAGTRHAWPTQAPHLPPPQSTAVSAPFLTLSPHVGCWQSLPTHTSELHCMALSHLTDTHSAATLFPAPSVFVSGRQGIGKAFVSATLPGQ